MKIQALIIATLSLIAASAHAFPGPSGAMQHTGRLGGSMDIHRSTTMNSGNTQMNYTSPRGNTATAESQATLRGNKLNYSGSASTSTGRGVTSQGSATLGQNSISGSNSTSTNSGKTANSTYQVERTDTGEVTGSATTTTGAGYSATVTGTGDQSGGSVNVSTSNGKNKTVTYGDERP